MIWKYLQWPRVRRRSSTAGGDTTPSSSKSGKGEQRRVIGRGIKRIPLDTKSNQKTAKELRVETGLPLTTRVAVESSPAERERVRRERIEIERRKRKEKLRRQQQKENQDKLTKDLARDKELLKAAPERWRPDITPADNEFVEKLAEFKKTLAEPSTTINDILTTQFEPHERELIIPTSKGTNRALAEIQAGNRKLYSELLQSGRFRNYAPGTDLAFKLTLLFFGLPVAPITPSFEDDEQFLDISEDDDDEDDSEDFEPSPGSKLRFLNGYKVRMYEKDSLRPPDQELEQYHVFDHLRKRSVKPSLDLRGGGTYSVPISDSAGDEDNGDGPGSGGTRGNPTALQSSGVAGPGPRTAAHYRGTQAAQTAGHNRSASGTGQSTRGRGPIDNDDDDFISNGPRNRREQSYANPVSVHDEQQVPVNGAPLEQLLHIGFDSLPVVALGLPTSTEAAQLRQEVFKLYKERMDRIHSCPFAGCSASYSYADDESLQNHLQEAHVKRGVNRDSIEDYFSKHPKELEELIADRIKKDMESVVAIPVPRRRGRPPGPSSRGVIGSRVTKASGKKRASPATPPSARARTSAPPNQTVNHNDLGEVFERSFGNNPEALEAPVEDPKAQLPGESDSEQDNYPEVVREQGPARVQPPRGAKDDVASTGYSINALRARGEGTSVENPVVAPDEAESSSRPEPEPVPAPTTPTASTTPKRSRTPRTPKSPTLIRKVPRTPKKQPARPKTSKTPPSITVTEPEPAPAPAPATTAAPEPVRKSDPKPKYGFGDKYHTPIKDVERTRKRTPVNPINQMRVKPTSPPSLSSPPSKRKKERNLTPPPPPPPRRNRRKTALERTQERQRERMKKWVEADLRGKANRKEQEEREAKEREMEVELTGPAKIIDSPAQHWSGTPATPKAPVPPPTENFAFTVTAPDTGFPKPMEVDGDTPPVSPPDHRVTQPMKLDSPPGATRRTPKRNLAQAKSSSDERRARGRGLILSPSISIQDRAGETPQERQQRRWQRNYRAEQRQHEQQQRRGGGGFLAPPPTPATPFVTAASTPWHTQAQFASQRQQQQQWQQHQQQGPAFNTRARAPSNPNLASMGAQVNRPQQQPPPPRTPLSGNPFESADAPRQRVREAALRAQKKKKEEEDGWTRRMQQERDRMRRIQEAEDRTRRMQEAMDRIDQDVDANFANFEEDVEEDVARTVLAAAAGQTSSSSSLGPGRPATRSQFQARVEDAIAEEDEEAGADYEDLVM